MNNCPVYRHITGHGYGSIYPGPMGVVLTPLLEGYDNTDKMAFACSLCGACDDACPVKIPLHELIHHHRLNIVAEGRPGAPEKAAFATAGKVLSNRKLSDLATGAGSKGMKIMGGSYGALGSSTSWIPVLCGWTGSRDFELLADERFRDWFENHTITPCETDTNKNNETKGGEN